MLCPVCPDTQLMMTERQNIEIDYCPKCRGVWLDRGELDKIIERSHQETQREVAQASVLTQPQPVEQAAQPFLQQPAPGYGEHSFGHGGAHHDEQNRFTQGNHGGQGFLRRLFD